MKSEESQGASQAEEPVLKVLLRDKDCNYIMPFDPHVRLMHGQPRIINNYPPLKLGGEVVTNFVEMPHKESGEVQTDESPFKALNSTNPVFPQKPGELFGMGLMRREVLPFRSLDLETGDAGNPNIIVETERRIAIAQILARIIIRTQQEETNEEFDK